VFALCIESSHSRGFGHLYRSLNLAEALMRRGRRVRFLVNEDAQSLAILSARGHNAEVVELTDITSGWEEEAIARLGFQAWINDRLDTSGRHGERVKAAGLPLVTFDDRGDGARAADLHIAALAFEDGARLQGRRVLQGPDYLILNPEIARHRRLRTEASPLLVTLGGTDTWGATVKVVDILARRGKGATVVLGPGFRHHSALTEVQTSDFMVKEDVPSLIAEMAMHSLAVTGGGITPFEANAAGLPCIVVANEDFEITAAQTLQRMGSAVFAGHHSQIDASVFDRTLPIETMSRAALDSIGLEGTQRVVDAIESLAAA
jgi:spore coat polysaccharide biosynthesis predicted glycosyltransferase SpsG